MSRAAKRILELEAELASLRDDIATAGSTLTLQLALQRKAWDLVGVRRYHGWLKSIRGLYK